MCHWCNDVPKPHLEFCETGCWVRRKLSSRCPAVGIPAASGASAGGVSAGAAADAPSCDVDEATESIPYSLRDIESDVTEFRVIRNVRFQRYIVIVIYLLYSRYKKEGMFRVHTCQNEGGNAKVSQPMWAPKITYFSSNYQVSKGRTLKRYLVDVPLTPLILQTLADMALLELVAGPGQWRIDMYNALGLEIPVGHRLYLMELQRKYMERRAARRTKEVKQTRARDERRTKEFCSGLTKPNQAGYRKQQELLAQIYDEFGSTVDFKKLDAPDLNLLLTVANQTVHAQLGEEQKAAQKAARAAKKTAAAAASAEITEATAQSQNAAGRKRSRRPPSQQPISSSDAPEAAAASDGDDSSDSDSSRLGAGVSESKSSDKPRVLAAAAPGRPAGRANDRTRPRPGAAASHGASASATSTLSGTDSASQSASHTGSRGGSGGHGGPAGGGPSMLRTSLSAGVSQRGSASGPSCLPESLTAPRARGVPRRAASIAAAAAMSTSESQDAVIQSDDAE